MIQSMIDLPTNNPALGNTLSAHPYSPASKEKETIGLHGSEVTHLQEVGRDAPLPSEVAAVGVKAHPTVVPLPQNVAQLGVKSVGANSVLGSGQSVKLPLTEEQIIEGEKQPVTSSWKWLAAWCRRKLDQFALHMARK
jgi:hypothetical protein